MRFSALTWVCGWIGLVPLACVYDPDDRCGPRQVSVEHDRCACEEGFVPGEKGCAPCGENERAAGNQCVCADGYARASQAEACEPIPAELGAPCDSSDLPCADGAYSLCHVTDGTSGYCTNACTSSSQCDGGYQCQETADESYCRRPPLGFAQSCDTDADCADGEATFCENIQSHSCLVPCAAGSTNGCFIGESCCDFALFRPVCVPTQACAENGGAVLE